MDDSGKQVFIVYSTYTTVTYNYPYISLIGAMTIIPYSGKFSLVQISL